MHNIKQAFIFAAGRGERMKPLTDKIPKPLIPIHNRPIIEYIIDKLLKIPTIQKIVINAFYLADQIEKYVKSLNNPKIIISFESEKLETGGGLFYAQNLFDKDQPLLLINGDILWFDSKVNAISQLYDAFFKNNCEIMLGLKNKTDFEGYDGIGDFNLNDNQQLSKKDVNQYVFTGLQIISPKALIAKNIKQKSFSMSYFYQNSLDKNNVLQNIKGIELEGRFFHIGNVPAIARTEYLTKSLIF